MESKIAYRVYVHVFLLFCNLTSARRITRNMKVGWSWKGGGGSGNKAMTMVSKARVGPPVCRNHKPLLLKPDDCAVGDLNR